MTALSRFFALTLSATWGILTASAQMGDIKDTGATQKPPRPEWVLPAPALSPEEALKSFRLQPGFRIEIVASDPLVKDPVAMDFDADGRLWVIELLSYMPDVDGRGESEPINRIVVLEDTNKDGRMDKSTVFMDGLGLARTIKVLKDGVLIGDPPNLWHVRDTDGDGRGDEKTALATDFSLREMNPESGANAMMWGLDNWIGGAQYGRRFRLQDGKWIESPVINRGQWGQSRDDYGRTFTNTNSDYLRVDLVPNHYQARNRNLGLRPGGRDGVVTGVYYQADANQEVWPIRPTPGVNRGYQEDTLRPNGALKKFTATGGPVIYRGDNFPAEYYGNYFTPEPAAHLIRRAILTEKDGIISGQNAYEKQEFLASTDERFRPVNLYTAPDGTLYVVDFYRGILQHRQFMTTYIRRQIIERGLEKPTRLGRIYRIVHESKKPGPAPALSQASGAELATHLAHPNGWWRETSRQLLIQRGDKSVIPAVKKLALANATSDAVRLEALWTLEGLGAIDAAVVTKTMERPDPKIRAAGIRLSEPLLARGNTKVFDAVVKHARDASREVRLQAAWSLGEAKPAARDEVLADLLRKDATTLFMIPAVVSSLAGREFATLERLAASPAWRESHAGFAEVFEVLAGTIANQGNPQRMDRLYQMLREARQPKWQRLALLKGLRGSGPIKVAAFPRELEITAQSAEPDIAKGASELLSRAVWPGKFGTGPRPLTAAEKEQFEVGRKNYQTICAACHGQDGQGLPSIGVPLVNSPFVLGSVDNLARIVLKGKTGKNPAPMPPLEMLPNETLASALTYIRRSWGHEASAVSVGTISEMRRNIIVRGQPYTEKELEELSPAESN